MKPKLLLILAIVACNCLLLLSPAAFPQGVGINTTGAVADPSAIWDASSTNMGVLIPRMTTAQRGAIATFCSCTPATGLMIFNTDCNEFQYYISIGWISIINSNSIAPSESVWPSDPTQTSFSANWSHSASATTYYLDVASDAAFTTFLAGYNNLNVGNVLTFSIIGLTCNTPYYCRVRAGNGCSISGNSLYSSIALTTCCGPPSQPDAITGNTTLCASAGNESYSILPVSDATSYTWSVPSGASITAGQGSTGITVNFGSTSGYISVTANNSCGSGSPGTLAITVNSASSTPGAISGNTTVCANATGETYSISPVAGATSYLWSVPDGASIAAGQGSTGITVNMGGASGNVTVIANNACGSSSPGTLAITVNGVPSTPGATAATNISANSFSANWSSTLGATTYFLDVSTNSGFSSFVTGYNNLNVGNVITYSVTGLSGNTTYYYRVRAGNSCGSGANSNTITTTTVYSVWVLVVGGGGGGSAGNSGNGGGAGGAGGFQENTSFIVSPQTYSVTLGSGGTAGSGCGSGGSGSNSVFSTITATGGGSGGGTDCAGHGTPGGTGGSGGGGGCGFLAGGGGAGGTGTVGQGNDGSSGNSGSSNGGGAGGGASTAAGGPSPGIGGAGGAGMTSSISGASVTYCGGGGGGGGLTGGAGGAGGGGAGGGASGTGTPGTANTGGGGGAGGLSSGSQSGGAGGSGIVIISYPTGSIIASGGTITYSGGNTIHTFTTSGTFTIGVGTVNVLVVGGGGGGGYGGGGGGGAGGYQTNSAFVVTQQAYSVTVGGGGAGAAPASTGSNGDNSIFGIITSTGGGGGGSWNSAPNSGGSGGGAGANTQTNGGTGGQGHNGGSSVGASPGPGGGGGAGAVGIDGTFNNIAGAGGDGTANNISGSSVTYAGGGGGGAGPNGGAGGAGGGGAGAPGSGPGTDGAANTGGGGGGSNNSPPGNGGSGIVIISYPTGSLNATGGTITTSGGNTIHTFTTNGTFTVQ